MVPVVVIGWKGTSVGKANRQRRKAKEKDRKRQQQRSAGPAGPHPFFGTAQPHRSRGPAPAEMVELLVDDAVHAVVKDDAETFAECVTALTDLTGRAGRNLSARLVDRTLAAV